jgi:hypothetical protein
MPQFPSDQLPNSLTVHGFGQDGNGELYAMTTNTPANGTGGIIYKFVAVPEPGSVVLLCLSVIGLYGIGRRRPSA